MYYAVVAAEAALAVAALFGFHNIFWVTEYKAQLLLW